ncbi:MAG: beta-ketoacyl synthase N-terminal-like domain-containing protein [Pirellulales bacterium]
MKCWSDERRVVVTGLGVVCPLGLTLDDLWRSLTQPLHTLSQSVANGAIAGFQGRIDDFGPLTPVARKSLRKALKLMNRATQLGVAAAQRALADSALSSNWYEPHRVGVSFGAGNVSVMPEDFVAGIHACLDEQDQFDFARWGTDGIPKVAPLWMLRCLPNMPACHLSIINDFRGPNNTITQRGAAANLAIAEAFHLICDGDADAMITGACGTALEPFNLLHGRMDNELGEKTGSSSEPCRPFDLRRTGPPPAEAAGALVLEELCSATERGATIYGEIRAAASSCVPARDSFGACQKAMQNALRLTLGQTRIAPENIGHVHAHGLGTRQSDIAEAQAIRRIFGRQADRLPVVAAKGHMGNASAGSGAIEIAGSLLALRRGSLFPVRNYEQPDPDCPVLPVTGDDVAAGTSFLNLNMTAGGVATCLAIEAWAA